MRGEWGGTFQSSIHTIGLAYLIYERVYVIFDHLLATDRQMVLGEMPSLLPYFLPQTN